MSDPDDGWRYAYNNAAARAEAAEARVKELEAVGRGIYGLAAAQDEGHVGHSIFGTIVSICDAALARAALEGKDD